VDAIGYGRLKAGKYFIISTFIPQLDPQSFEKMLPNTATDLAQPQVPAKK
jgi:hypothetical protein